MAIMDEGDYTDPAECDACHAQGVPLVEYSKAWPLRTTEKKMLCDLCASTRVGQIDDYKHLRENPDLVQMQRQINYVGNEILKAIKAREHGHGN